MIHGTMVGNLPAIRRKAQTAPPRSKAMWCILTNNELQQAIRKIVNSCTNADDVNRRAKDELGYPYRISVSYSKPNGAGQRMSMFHAFARNGIILS